MLPFPFPPYAFDQSAALTVGSASTLKVGLISFWEFSSSGALLNDSAPAGNTLTNSGGAVSSNNTPTIVGNYVQLVRASSQSLTVANNASLNTGSTNFSVQTWVYADTLIDGSALIGKVGSFGNFEYQISNNFGTGQNFRFVTYSAGTTTNLTIASTSANNTGQWYHVVATYNAATFTGMLYVTSTTGQTITSGTGSAATSSLGTTPFTIGFAGVDYWNGREDQVGFWKKVLSSAEVTQLYNNGSGLAYSAM